MNPGPADGSEPPLLAHPSGLELRLPPPKQAAAPAKTPKQWLTFGALTLVGGAIGYFGAHFGMEVLLPVSPKLYKLVVIVALPLIWLGVVGWHELGHLAGGWLVGGRFLFWVTGPLMIRRTPTGIRVMWNRSVNLSGGMAACLPLDPARLTPQRTAVMIVAGPLFSLVLTVAGLWAAVWLANVPGVVPPARAVAQHIALATAGISLLIFGVTALPGIAGGFKTDGKRVIDLLRGDRHSDQETAVIALTIAGLAGTRPADYNRELVKRAIALKDGSLFDLYGHLNVYYHAADLGRWADAQQILDHVVKGRAQLVPYVRDSLHCEYAWLLAVNRGAEAAPAARAWLDLAGRLEFDPATRLRAEAAVLLVEGKAAEAGAKAREGLVMLRRRSLSPVESPFAREALEELIRRAGA